MLGENKIRGEIHQGHSPHAGKLSPELLFPDDEELTDRLRRHPALLWKMENGKWKT
jgi:hypothetical protein